MCHLGATFGVCSCFLLFWHREELSSGPLFAIFTWFKVFTSDKTVKATLPDLQKLWERLICKNYAP